MAKTSPPQSIQWLKDIDLLSVHAGIRKDDMGQLWDPVRQTWLTVQPEEWVRLCLIHFLAEHLGFSLRRMSAERNTSRTSRTRFDLTLYDKTGSPFLLCECKSPQTPYRIDHWLQLSQYNKDIQARFLLWTNGPQAWLWDNEKGQFVEDLAQCIRQYL